jgi:hypothetical protein
MDSAVIWFPLSFLLLACILLWGLLALVDKL